MNSPKSTSPAFVLLLAVLAGCQSVTSTSVSLRPLSANSGSVKQVKICSGFGCEYKMSLAFTAGDLRHMRRVMAASNGDATKERAALANLVAWKERLAQQRLRLPRDNRLSYQRDLGIPGQMDCIDESSNTLAFLTFLEGEGLLKNNKPSRIAGRGYFFDGRYPHRTAVVIDPDGRDWAIDSWKKDGGELPQVVELAIWYKERTSEYR